MTYNHSCLYVLLRFSKLTSSDKLVNLHLQKTSRLLFLDRCRVTFHAKIKTWKISTVKLSASSTFGRKRTYRMQITGNQMSKTDINNKLCKWWNMQSFLSSMYVWYSRQQTLPNHKHIYYLIWTNCTSYEYQ